MATKNGPNQFDLSGENISVSYSTSSIGGKPLLTYKKGRQSLSFSGAEIDTLATRIGTLVSVLIAKVPDKSSTTFTLLLPTIQLSEPPSKVSFRAVGITTETKTSIAGPVKGAQQSYKTVELRGTAQQVEFLKAKSATARGKA